MGMPVFPEMPPELRSWFPNSFWNWWQAFKTYLTALARGSSTYSMPAYANNAAALAGGLAVGELYRAGDNVCVVH